MSTHSAQASSSDAGNNDDDDSENDDYDDDDDQCIKHICMKPLFSEKSQFICSGLDLG